MQPHIYLGTNISTQSLTINEQHSQLFFKMNLICISFSASLSLCRKHIWWSTCENTPQICFRLHLDQTNRITAPVTQEEVARMETGKTKPRGTMPSSSQSVRRAYSIWTNTNQYPLQMCGIELSVCLTSPLTKTSASLWRLLPYRWNT